MSNNDFKKANDFKSKFRVKQSLRIFKKTKNSRYFSAGPFKMLENTWSQGLYINILQSSRPDLFLRKDVLRISSMFTGEHPCWIMISIKLQNNFIEIAVTHGCSPVNLLHISITLFIKTPLNGYVRLLRLWLFVHLNGEI